ncbi:toprim domain-containing protein [Candidatus Woesearchaeota archaeon]|nr:toprim domain-containing protein [Candidatus Woesearchaeota archaeon]
MDMLHNELTDLRDLTTGKPIIVEGLKDKKALESLGFRNIFMATKPLYKTVEEIAARYEQAIILTDLDREGKILYGRLSQGLQRHGVRIDNQLRTFLMKNTKLRQIEGLPRYIDNQNRTSKNLEPYVLSREGVF